MAQANLTERQAASGASLAELWRGKRVLITGYSGFIGSWLATALLRLDAEVHGFAANEDQHSRERAEGLATLGAAGTVGDVRDYEAVHRVMSRRHFDAVFHLAAQPLVSVGLKDPRNTLTTNAVGSINVLEAARSAAPGALVHVTSDKCYRNRGWQWPYREVDELGADCPYSTSKAVAELVFETYASLPSTADRRVPSVSVRFGNVIGGGDYAACRLVPGIMAALRTGQAASLRKPEAVRPWQHVLDIVNGLLKVASALFDARVESGEVFNFAPPGEGATVRELVAELMVAWGDAGGRPVPTRIEQDPALHEQVLLRLDGRKAASALGWRHLLDLRGSASAIVAWELAVLDGLPPIEAVERQVRNFLADPVVGGAGEIAQITGAGA